MPWNRPAYSASARTVTALLVVLAGALLIDDGVSARPFFRTPSFPAGSNPARLVAADFDGDGRIDVAVADAGHSWDAAPAATVGILFGTGGGMYRWGGTAYTSTLAGAPALFGGDFNQDGKQDLFLESGSAAPYKGVTLLGQGNGTFVPMPVVDYPGLAYPADFNADGRIDFVVPSPNATASQVRVYLGALDGSFTGQTPFVAPASLSFTKLPFVVGDLNGDRKADLMVTPAANNLAVGVLLGLGTGSFTLGTPLATGQTLRTGFIGDVSGDGKADFVVQAWEVSGLSLRAWRGHGDGLFDAAPFYSSPVGYGFEDSETVSAIVAGDLNGDAWPDMAAVSMDVAWVYFGNGSGFSSLGGRVVGQRTQAILIGDFDGAGANDLAVAAYSDTVSFILARPGGTYLPPPLPPSQALAFSDLLSADFTGDGRPDVAVLDAHLPPCDDFPCPRGAVEVFAALPQGGFGPATLQLVGIQPQSFLAVDYDRDGKMDLVSANFGDTSGTNPPPGTLSLLRGHGDGSFDPEVAVQVGSWPRSVAAGDFDLDGDIDLAVAEDYLDEVRILLRTAGGTYVAQPVFQAGFAPVRIASADLNGDGRLDLAVATQGRYEVGVPGALSWFRNLGNGTFAAAVVLAQVNMASDLAVVDLDADGDPDLVLTDQGNVALEVGGQEGGATVLLNQGNAVFAPTSYPAARLARRVQVADFNGDGAPDLMTESWTWNLTFFPGLGNGAFGASEQMSQWGCGRFVPTRLPGDTDVDLVALCGASINALENEAPFPDLRVPDPSRLDWSPISLAGRYDVIQGSLPILRSTGGNFGSAVTACLQNDGLPIVVNLAQTPPVGSGFFYLVRPVWPNGTPGSYDGEAGQAAPRDASIQSSGAACP